MAHPNQPIPPESLPPEEKVLQLKGRISAEESIAQAKKMVLRLLIGGLVLGVITSIAIIKLIDLLDKTFDTDLAPSRSPSYHQNR